LACFVLLEKPIPTGEWLKAQRNIKQKTPAKVLLTDITYMPYPSSVIYLSAIKDSASNEILAYNLFKNLRLNIALDTIKKLLKKNGSLFARGAYIRSDQGIHYTHPQF